MRPRLVLIIGAGQSSVPEIANATERDHWKTARREYRGHLEWEGQLFRVLAREDGWAVVVPWSMTLVDAIDADDACVSWCDFFEQPEVQRAAQAQGDLFARRP